MNITYPAFYVAACVVVALFGKGRLIGFWGFLVLGLVTHPLLALLLLVITAPVRFGGKNAPTHRPLRPGEKRPWFPVAAPPTVVVAPAPEVGAPRADPTPKAAE